MKIGQPHAELFLGMIALGLWLATGAAGRAAEETNPPPAVEILLPAAGSVVRELFSVEVHFNQPVLGLDAADLFINGVPATNVLEVAQGQFVFSFPQPADGGVLVFWRADHGITGT